MGDADECSEQVEGVEIATYIAALDGAFHQRINRSWIRPRDPSYSFEGLRRHYSVRVQ